MKVLLVFPPQFNPTQPYLSVPSLAARLRQEDIHVTARDLNVEFYQWALSRATVQEAAARVGAARDADEPVRELVERMGDFLSESVEEARAVFGSEDEFYDLGRYHWARTVVAQSLTVTGAGWGGGGLSLNKYQCRYSYHSSVEAARAADDEERNVVLRFLQGPVGRSLAAEKPDLVGLSVCSPFQVIGALTVARLVRSQMPEVPVVVGGGFFTRALHSAERAPGLEGLVDGVVTGEGEEALVRLCRVVRDRSRWSTVPNLVRIADGGRLCRPTASHREDMRLLPTPDFRGLPLDLYLSPRPVIPLLTSRGCYWHRCTFCTSYLTYGGSYSARPKRRLMEDFDRLVAQCSTKHFFLADQAVPPATLRWLAGALNRTGRNVTFYCQTRCDGEFDQEWLRSLRKAGCTKLYFGIESGSPAVVRRMDKGIDLRDAARVLRLCTEAGIPVHLFFLVGFPGETDEDRALTLTFLESIPDVVGAPGFSMNFAPFGLETMSTVGCDPPRFGLDEVRAPEGQDLPTHLMYSAAEGPSQETLPALVRALEEQAVALVRHRAYPTAGPHSSLYLSRAPAALTAHASRARPFPSFTESLGVRPRVAQGACVGHDDRGQPILYWPDAGVTRLLSEDGARMLELCSSDLTMEQICTQWAAEGRGKALRAWLVARELWEAGLLTA
jgi:hypothetical protein